MNMAQRGELLFVYEPEEACRERQRA